MYCLNEMFMHNDLPSLNLVHFEFKIDGLKILQIRD